MRTIPQRIWDLWNSADPTDQFIGDDAAPHGRITVELGWSLRTTNITGTYHRGPVRWFQRADNSQVETEIPNVATIELDRSIDDDAATCDIILHNVLPVSRTSGPVPGYYTFNYGESAESRARWGQAENAWHKALVPNALLRTYQGYGGRDLSIDDAVDQGFIVLTGLWLIDTVSPNADGSLHIHARDPAKLLIEQQIFPPLVPDRFYPLEYYRFVEHSTQLVSAYDHDTGQPDPDQSAIVKRSTFAGDSGDDGSHPGTNAFDGRPATFWVSEPHSVSSAYVWIEFNVGEVIDTVFVRPRYNYQCYVSVMVNGQWLDDAGTIPNVTGAAAIGYVKQFAVIQELYNWYELDTVYPATRVRLTFTNLLNDANYGGYRGIIYDVAVAARNKPVGHMTIVDLEAEPDGTGYLLVGSDGGVFTFGPGGRFYGSRGGNIENRPTSGMAMTSTGKGYWLVGQDGGVFAFGDAVYHGSLPGLGVTPNAPIVEIAALPDDSGYYLLGSDGGVFAFNAPYRGNAIGTAVPAPFVDIEVTPSGGGYWILAQSGGVVGHSAPVPGSAEAYTSTATGIAGHPNGNGYWITDEGGGVYTFGTGVHFFGSIPGLSPPVTLHDPIYDIEHTPSGNGYWLVGGDGGVFAFGDARFYGSLQAPFDWETPGNYTDYVQIIRDLLLWSGWWFYDPDYPATGGPAVYGNLESTGVYSKEPLSADLFDKRPVIDGIHQIKEIVGYLFFVDDEGAARFETPNWWQSGNFYEDGTATDFIPEIDERHNLISYGVDYNDQDARSEVIITTEDPTDDAQGTITTRITPPSASILRGQIRPAMWVNGVFTNKDEQKIMAELIGLHIWFSMRKGSATCVANPAIQINDQIRIFERNTSETYVHYVRGIKTSMDLEAGTYTMDLTTNWLGSDSNWVITRNAVTTGNQVQVSNLLFSWLAGTDSRHVTTFRLEQPTGDTTGGNGGGGTVAVPDAPVLTASSGDGEGHLSWTTPTPGPIVEYELYLDVLS